MSLKNRGQPRFFLPPNRVGGVESPSLAVLLIRAILNWVSLKCKLPGWNSKFSAPIELHSLIAWKMLLNKKMFSIVCINKVTTTMSRVKLFYDQVNYALWKLKIMFNFRIVFRLTAIHTWVTALKHQFFSS